jgi:hypothetical protein
LNDEAGYLFNETATEFSVTASHRTHVNGIVTINIDRIGYGQGCTMLSNITTVTVTCKKKEK